MTIYYVDPTSITHGAGTITDPYNNIDAVSVSAGDSLLFKRGTVCNIAVSAKTFSRGNSTNQIYFGAYGTGPRPILDNPTSVGSYIINAAGRQYWTFEDIWFRNTGATIQSCVYGAAQGTTVLPGAGSIIGMIWRRCKFSGAVGAGFSHGYENTSQVTSSGTLFEDCEFFDNGGHGLFLQGISSDNSIKVSIPVINKEKSIKSISFKYC